MSEAETRFVAYAFCVGDLLVEIDKDMCIQHVEGATDWFGIKNAQALLKKPVASLVAKEDRALLKANLDALSNASRLGPIRLRMGASSDKSRNVCLFLSRLTEKNDATQMVIVSAARIEGLGGDTAAPLIDKENFLEKLPDILSEHGKSKNLLVSLLQLADDLGPEDKDTFTRQLASLSIGGHSASEIAEGRYALIHEASDKKSAAHILETLSEATGQTFDSATIEPEETVSAGNEHDTARALVYSVRKFSDKTSDFSLSDLSKNYKQQLQDTKDRIASLRQLLAQKRFTIAYQPIVALSDESIHHVEALVRFDMRGGSPFEMITFAEEVGIISEFDSVMLGSVINRLIRLNAKDAPASIAVNLSAKSLTTESFVSDLVKKLRRHRVLSEKLLIEVTESGHVADLQFLADTIDKIREAGFAVCLDDFGAGLSGFQYLRQLKVDYVKIDGSYIRDAENDQESRAFLHAMVTLCHDLRIRTVGEWIETRDQAALLAKMGVDFGQGFLYGKPKPSLPKAMCESPTLTKAAAEG